MSTWAHIVVACACLPCNTHVYKHAIVYRIYIIHIIIDFHLLTSSSYMYYNNISILHCMCSCHQFVYSTSTFTASLQCASCMLLILMLLLLMPFFFPTGAVAPVFARATYQNRLPPTCIIISFCIQGGLAYLASRRNSRDSMKSAASNASIFSNEDIGPLAFQASARGRQRRTSNFLELPGKFNHIHCKCK